MVIYSGDEHGCSGDVLGYNGVVLGVQLGGNGLYSVNPC